MRVGVFSGSESGREVLRLVAGIEDVEVRTLDSWRGVRRQSRNLDLLVFVIVENAADQLDRLARERLGLGHRPVLVVTDALESVALHLHDVRIEEVLRLDHVTEEIPAAIHRAGTPMILQRAARRVEEAGHLPRPVKRFVTTALRAPTPFLRVNQVLRRIQVSSATLHRKWRRYVPTARPKELLDWILLLSAVRRKSFRATWGSVASELGVSRHTLRRAARRRTNLVLSDLDRASVEEPFDRFLRTALLTPRGA